MKYFVFVLSVFCLVSASYAALSYLYVSEKFKPVPYAEPSPVFSGRVMGRGIKILLHRVNNKKRLEKALRGYDGFETDVFYEGGEFYCAHDLKDVGKLRFEDLLSAARGRRDVYIWIDFQSEFSHAAAQKLKGILTAYGIPAENVILEARADAGKAFADEGFFTAVRSYGFDKKYTEERNRKNILRTERAVIKSGAAALSCSLNNYQLSKQYFPNMQKVVYYTKGSFKFSLQRSLILQNLLKDPAVKIILVHDYLP